MNRTILITGAAGFLGSHLCDAYINKGYKVIGIDNLSTGSKKNIEHLANNRGFKFVECDITKDLPKEVLDKKYSIVANLASPASPPLYQKLGIETLQVGSAGTLNMLELADKNGARFFHASTSEVYGDPEVHPQPETYKGSVNPYGPRSMYDESKRYAEALIYTYKKKYKINSCIGRFFNTYGPRMDPNDGRVVSNFIVQALKGEPLTIYGDGSQTRSFCYVDDLIIGIIKLIESAESQPINLGNPSEFTINDLAKVITKKLNKTATFKYMPLPGDDPMQRRPNIDRARNILNWHPVVSLDEGLDKTIKYFQDFVF